MGDEEGKHTEDDWVGGEDGEIWVQFLHFVREMFQR